MDLELSQPLDLDVVFAASDDPWVIIEQMLSTGTRYRTHYFCRACCADLTDLHIHHVACCPYCTTPLPFLLDGTDRPHAQWHGEWPYSLLRKRYVEWCSWCGRREGDQGEQLPDGKTRWTMYWCRLLANHDGPHSYEDLPRQAPPKNPLRGV